MDRRSTQALAACTRGRAWSVILVILLLVSLPAAASAAGSQERERELAKTLLNTLSIRPGPSRDVVIVKLVERGEAMVPALLFVGRNLTDVDQIEAVIGALRRLSPTSLEKYLLDFVSRAEPGPAASTAWRHLSEVGTPDAVPVVIEGMAGNTAYLKRIVERALVRLLIRHDSYETWDQVDALLNRIPDESRARVMCCIGETDAPDGLLLLARLVGRWPELDLALVTAIAQMPEAGLGEKVVPRLRTLLESRDMNVRREAVTALAVFADVDSAKSLIRLLDDEQRGIRANSHWALQKLSGLKFPDSSARWGIWHHEEVTWWEAEGEELLEVLRSGSGMQLIEALRVIAEHRLYRTRFSPLLRELLEHSTPEIRNAAEDALVQLGLIQGRRASDARTELASQGFHSVSREEFKRARTRPRAAAKPKSGGSRIVPIVGVAVLGLLFLRIFGPALLYRLAKFWGGGARREGPIEIHLDKSKVDSPRG